MKRYETRRVRIRHVHPDDYPVLHALECDPATAATWRYRGRLPTFGEYEAALWQRSQAILVSELGSTGEVVGYVQFHDYDARAGHGLFSLYAAPEYRGRGIVMESTLLFGDWVFDTFDVRWMYAHVFDMNLPQFASAIERGVLHRLGTMRSRVTVHGVPTDVHVIGSSRDNWCAHPMRQRMHRLQGRRND